MALLLAFAGALLACEDAAPTLQRYAVLIRVVSEDAEPIAGVAVLSNGAAIGSTDGAGELSASVQGQDGFDVSFSPRCPTGTRPQGQPAALKLRTLAGGRPEVEVACIRDKRTAALLVSAPGFGGLPVLVHDREVGRTDASGTAHLVLQGDPSTPLRVVLDTRALPNVVPASPHRDLQIGSRDDIVVFAPELAEVKKVAPKKRLAKKAQPPPRVFRPEKLR